MNQLIIQLLPYLVPSVVIILTYAWHHVYFLIPQAQRDVLDKVAGPILNIVEADLGLMTPEQKKAKALALIKMAFADFHVPAPPDSVINAFLTALLGGGK